MAKIRVCFNREELEKLDVGVMVESWDHRKSGVRNRRAYNEQFTQKEQRTLDRYYAIFYRWHLVTGIPDAATMDAQTYIFLRKAVAYFATV